MGRWIVTYAGEVIHDGTDHDGTERAPSLSVVQPAALVDGLDLELAVQDEAGSQRPDPGIRVHGGTEHQATTVQPYQAARSARKPRLRPRSRPLQKLRQIGRAHV